MPNKKISQLDQINSVAGTELVPVVQGGVVKRTTTSAFTGRLKELARAANATAIQDAKEVGRSTLIDGLSAGAVMQQDLSAVSAALHRSPNAVTAMFVYDTSKDSDGGAWTKRCQNTSWYNEALCGRWLGQQASEAAARAVSNATTNDYFQLTTDGKFYKLNQTSGVKEVFRGNKAEFPSIVAIVVEKATTAYSSMSVYDLTEAGSPMWMSFQTRGPSGTGIWYPTTGAATAVCTKEGILVLGLPDNTTNGGLLVADFCKDVIHRQQIASPAFNRSGFKISQRIQDSVLPLIPYSVFSGSLASSSVSSVAVTTLDNSPIDSISGLKAPTIAVATAGGISLIKNGTIYNSTQTISFDTVYLTPKLLIASRTGDSTLYYYPNPANTSSNFTLLTEAAGAVDFNQGTTTALALENRSEFARSSGAKIQLLKHNETTAAKGAAATITPTYNTGYMVGDIKRSYLASAVAKTLSGTEFAGRSLFLDGTQGVWYDPSDITTLYRDAAGTTPVTGVEQPVGLMLDKSKGLVLGSELVTNGDFSNGSTGWTVGTGWTVTGGEAVLSSTNVNQQISQSYSFVSGKFYEVTFTLKTVPTNNGRIAVTDNVSILYSSPVNQSGTFTFRFLATAGSNLIGFRNTNATVTQTSIDNISVRELPGNHAFNASGNSANFPVLSARYNLLTKTEQLSDAVWSKQNLSAAEVAGAGPDGTAASLLTENSASAFHLVDSAPNTVSAGAYSVVVYLKPNGRTLPLIQIKGVTPEGNATFNLTGIGSVQAQSNATASIEPASNGFYKCTVNVTATAGGSAYLRVFLDSNIYQGDGVKGLYVWHPDLRVANDALNQPAYQRVNTSTDYDTVGFKPYLRFNGTNQWLQTNSIDFTYGDKMFVSAGVRKLSDSATGHITELGIGAQNGSFYVAAPNTVIPASYLFAPKGSTGTILTSSLGYSAPITNIISGIDDISGDQAILRVNGSQAAISTADQGTGNFGNYPLYIGARAGTSLWFNGRLYGMVIAGKQASAAEIASIETFINSKTSAY